MGEGEVELLGLESGERELERPEAHAGPRVPHRSVPEHRPEVELAVLKLLHGRHRREPVEQLLRGQRDRKDSGGPNHEPGQRGANPALSTREVERPHQGPCDDERRDAAAREREEHSDATAERDRSPGDGPLPRTGIERERERDRARERQVRGQVILVPEERNERNVRSVSPGTEERLCSREQVAEADDDRQSARDGDDGEETPTRASAAPQLK
ncbi:MAG: hypothetical protein Q8L14_41985 [Myxococcales bacterium]|nr:hypothetical protein [Myxococcales bacterium]